MVTGGVGVPNREKPGSIVLPRDLVSAGRQGFGRDRRPDRAAEKAGGHNVAVVLQRRPSIIAAFEGIGARNQQQRCRAGRLDRGAGEANDAVPVQVLVETLFQILDDNTCAGDVEIVRGARVVAPGVHVPERESGRSVGEGDQVTPGRLNFGGDRCPRRQRRGIADRGATDLEQRAGTVIGFQVEGTVWVFHQGGCAEELDDGAGNPDRAIAIQILLEARFGLFQGQVGGGYVVDRCCDIGAVAVREPDAVEAGRGVLPGDLVSAGRLDLGADRRPEGGCERGWGDSAAVELERRAGAVCRLHQVGSVERRDQGRGASGLDDGAVRLERGRAEQIAAVYQRGDRDGSLRVSADEPPSDRHRVLR